MGDIDRARRLSSLKSHSGFYDLVALSAETVHIAEEAFINFAGWDKDELSARMIAFRAAKQFHALLFSKVDDAIAEGVEELRAGKETQPDAFSKESVDAADELRNTVLKDETRIAGTY